jgi:PAS domain S-box-containing protein
MAMVLDHTTDGVLLADTSGTIVYVSEPLLELFGYRAGDLIGRPLEVLLPDDSRKSHRRAVEAYVHDPKPRPMGREDLDIEGRHADGSHIPIDVQLNSLPGTDLVAATVRDMTAQRRAAAESALARIDLGRLRVETDRLRAALDLVIQQLFALGMSIAAGAANETLLADRMATATHGIDEIIESVQTVRQAVGP